MHVYNITVQRFETLKLGGDLADFFLQEIICASFARFEIARFKVDPL